MITNRVLRLAKGKPPRLHFGNFVVTTNPEIHASVSIDGISYPGTTPFSREKLLPGKHTLRLSKEMYLTYEQEFTINKGKMTTVTAKMQPNFANLTVNAGQGDEIIIDRQKKGSVTYNGRLLKGIHIIEIKHANYYPESRQITIVPGHALTEAFTLKPKTGILSVMTTPIGATVYLNDKNEGQTPLFIDSLIMGTYTLRLQKQGYASVQKQVAVTENKTTNIKLTLSPAQEVKISSEPSGAKLYVDGVYHGVTPLTLSLSLVRHQLKLQKEDYESLVSNTLITTDVGQLNFKLIRKHRKKKPKPYTMFGLGYVRGAGVLGGLDFTIIGQYEISLSLFEASPLRSIPYQYTSDSAISVSVELGIRINNPVPFSIHGGWGTRVFSDPSNTQDKIKFNSAIIGLTLPIRLSSGFGLYLKTDYWLHTENGGQFVFALGLVVTM